MQSVCQDFQLRGATLTWVQSSKGFTVITRGCVLGKHTQKRQFSKTDSCVGVQDKQRPLFYDIIWSRLEMT